MICFLLMSVSSLVINARLDFCAFPAPALPTFPLSAFSSLSLLSLIPLLSLLIHPFLASLLQFLFIPPFFPVSLNSFLYHRFVSFASLFLLLFPHFSSSCYCSSSSFFSLHHFPKFYISPSFSLSSPLSRLFCSPLPSPQVLNSLVIECTP